MVTWLYFWCIVLCAWALLPKALLPKHKKPKLRKAHIKVYIEDGK